MLTCSTCGRENPDDAAFCMSCATPLTPGAPAREQRKTITVLFCGLVGSTTLAERHDPEVAASAPAALLRGDARGGRAARRPVEKFIGDAVVAVFGMPQVHEDDALRAVRAASEMRDGLAVLAEGSAVELVSRIGITTGEVLVGGGDPPVVGDPMNTAARLQTAAEPGEILIGEPTYRLVRDAVVAEPVEPLDAQRQDGIGSGVPACSEWPRSRRCAPAAWMPRWSDANGSARSCGRHSSGRSRIAPATCSRCSAWPAQGSPVWSRSSSRWSSRTSCVGDAFRTATGSPSSRSPRR